MDGHIVWTPGITLEAVEKQVVLAAFRHYRGNKTATATALGIAIRTLDNKLEKYEADGKIEKERQDHERKQREEFLHRARGGGSQPDNVYTGMPAAGAAPAQSGIRTAVGVPVESALGAAAQHSVPVPERKEIQGVLPAQAAASGARKGR